MPLMLLTLLIPLALTESPADLNGRLKRHAAIDLICGSRCVKRVLEHYGRREELIDLVRELQGAAIRRPANLRDMKLAIERRGISTVAVLVPPANLRWLDWGFPVIAHFDGRGSDVGHFRVILPAGDDSGGMMRVWDGLHGEAPSGARLLGPDASGVLLLTSPSPIDRAPCPTKGIRLWLRLCAIVAIAPALALVTPCVLRSRARR